MSKTELHCYFCSSKEEEVNYLIEGDDAYICDYCVDKANLVISENNKSNNKNDFELKKPKEIKNYLDQHIIGQEDAKKIQANRRERSLYVKVREAVILPLHAQK